MKQIDWGPLPKLAQQLALTRRTFAFADWSQVVQSAGGLWEAVVLGRRDDFWPAALREPKKNWRAQWSEFLRNMFPGVQAPHVNEMFDTLSESYVWLASRNLRVMTPKFLPFWRDLPWPLLNISAQGVVWALAAYNFQFQSKKDLEQMELLLQESDAQATAGDYIALHLCLEEILCHVAASFRSSEDKQTGVDKDIGPRCQGGLRSGRFINSYRKLSQAPATSAAAKRFALLQPMIKSSSLTQLIYLDLIERLDTDRAPDSAVLLTLTGHIEQPDKAGNGSQPNESRKAAGWRELWLSHLARSMLAACSSKSPSYEAWQAAVKDHENIETEVRAQIRSKLTSINLPKNIAEQIRQHPRVRAAKEKVDALWTKVRQQYLQRWEMAATWFAGCEYFKLRFLDLLVRQISSEEGPQMAARWPHLIQGRIPAPYAAEKFFNEGDEGVCFRKFETIVFGPLGETEQNASPPPGEHLRWRSALNGLLRSGGMNAAQISKQVGVTLESGTRLLDRFERMRIVLPIPGEKGDAPAAVYADWITTLLSRLSAEQTGNVRSRTLP